MSEQRAIVCIDKACALADVSRRTIYNWLHAGKLEYKRTAGGSIRIFADTLFRPGGPIGRTGKTITVTGTAA